MKHIVMFSGGITSWVSAKRVAERHGTTDLVLLFTDTNYEDEDTYRWMADAAANIGVLPTIISDGRTPWQVFSDQHIIGNARVAPCSSQLKQRVCRNWLRTHADPNESILYLGYDWTELHRLDGTRKAMEPYRVEAPMTEKPYMTKMQMLRWAESESIRPQRMYQLGFTHANCGGRCVRGGIGHWLHLLQTWPDRYAEVEQLEQGMREQLGKNHTILRDRSGGILKPLTLRELRERHEAKPQQFILDLDDTGGCGCFVEVEK